MFLLENTAQGCICILHVVRNRYPCMSTLRYMSYVVQMSSLLRDGGSRRDHCTSLYNMILNYTIVSKNMPDVIVLAARKDICRNRV
jgi:hypothetical protein